MKLEEKSKIVAGVMANFDFAWMNEIQRKLGSEYFCHKRQVFYTPSVADLRNRAFELLMQAIDEPLNGKNHISSGGLVVRRSFWPYGVMLELSYEPIGSSSFVGECETWPTTANKTPDPW